jgi:hypothetical protein
MKMMLSVTTVALALVVLPAFAGDNPAPPSTLGPDRTSFQEWSTYNTKLDLGSDMAMVYGVRADFAERAKVWRDKGYTVSMMTGIAWGGYEEYYVTPDGLKKDEIQTEKSGKLIMHGENVGYNVPTDSYIEYIKKYVEPAVDAGAQAIFLEEPEFWTRAGWSAAFKNAWQAYYGEPWQEPDSSVDAQYRASRLKYEMYFKALREVAKHVKERAAAQGRQIECHVPTHSLINYSHWGIVSPESHLMDIKEMDGYIAQVWSGTARTRNWYRGKRASRIFESAYLEYGQMLAMVRPTGRKVWFLADPVEDDPGHTWNEYRRDYECTVIASLFWPEVSRYEVMPWPSRIFQGSYPKVDMDGKSNAKEGIPTEYATQLLTIINALNDMDQPVVSYDCGTRGVGVIVSDSMMFQREMPNRSDPDLGGFFGVALPLIKSGVPVEMVQMENLPQANTLATCRVAVLTYEGQKPLKPEYHDQLDAWVRGGGCLLFVDDNADPYHHVREWWNDQGKNESTASDDLLKRLGVTEAAKITPEAVGKGWVRVVVDTPGAIQRREDGAQQVLNSVAGLLEKLGEPLKTQNYLKLQRGPYIVVSVMEESVSHEPLKITGQFVDLFDPMLPVVTDKVLKPGERALLFDIPWARRQGMNRKVAAASTRVRDEHTVDDVRHFTTRGPEGTRARARVFLSDEPKGVTTEPAIPVTTEWDNDSKTLWLDFDNAAQDIEFNVQMR